MTRNPPPGYPIGERKPPGRPKGAINWNPDDWIPVILNAVANGTMPTVWCALEGHPSWATVCKWRRTVPGFDEQLQQAREDGIDVLAEEVIPIVDGERPALLSSVDDRTRADFRLRLASRISSRYAERRHVEQTGSSTVTIVSGVPDPEPSDLLDDF